MREVDIICPRCKGKGALWDPTVVFLGVITVGMGFILGKDRCGRCLGKGTIRILT